METRFKKLWIAPRIDHVTRGIDFDDRRREFAPIQVAFDNILPVQYKDVILSIDADTAQPSQHPPIGQRLRPVRISLIVRRWRLRLEHYRGNGQHSSHDK